MSPSPQPELNFAEHLTDIVARFDPEFRHTYVNRAVEAVTGLPREAFVGKTNRDLGMPPDLVELWDGKLRQVFADGRPSEVYFSFAAPDGLHHITTRLLPEFGPDGKVSSVLTFARDDTAYHQVVAENRALEQSRDALEKSHAETLENTLVQTIKALSSTLEKRDPYTAGHQSRTAELARRAGSRLGLGETQLRGLWFGALIHDIGKIFIPAEILNRPGKLNVHEFGLIKSHPEVGFDIVKDIDFPWPVAQMIVQHHERMDGSGYPHGLRGEQISLEARILAVADVVEAMTSHRPYRPALDLSAGVSEITDKAGTHFDPAVVGAMIAVIAEDADDPLLRR